MNNARPWATITAVTPAGKASSWIFREIVHYLATGEDLPPPRVDEVRELLLAHLEDHYRFYGAGLGVRTARKHIIWYTRGLAGGRTFCNEMKGRRLPRAAACGRRFSCVVMASTTSG